MLGLSGRKAILVKRILTGYKGANMNNIGCPYKKMYVGIHKEHCPVINKSVEGFVMCEVDWESCPDYQAQRDMENTLEQVESELIDKCRNDRPMFRLECEAMDCFECRRFLDYASEEQLRLFGEK